MRTHIQEVWEKWREDHPALKDESHGLRLCQQAHADGYGSGYQEGMRVAELAAKVPEGGAAEPEH